MKKIVLLEKTKVFANLQQSQERKNKIKTSDFWFLYESCGELQKPTYHKAFQFTFIFANSFYNSCPNTPFNI